VTVEVPLANGRGVALVDAEDAARVLRYRWYRHEVSGKVYARNKRAGYLHRFLMEPSAEMEVDHISGDGLDNRRVNLRVCTHAQNQQNRVRAQGRSGYRGVSWWSTRGKWTVRVRVAGRVHHGGHYDDVHEAGRVAAEMRRRLMSYSVS